MSAFSIAIKGKGSRLFIRRFRDITRRYGLTPHKMERAIAHFQLILDEFGCSATFPITAVTAQRRVSLLNKFKGKNIEFAVHGYQHIDHSKLDFPHFLKESLQARNIFVSKNVPVSGYRCPYLRYNNATLPALQQAGFLYDSSQSLVWDVLKDGPIEQYRRAIDFYGARPFRDYPSLPRLENGLVEIPYCLPDDESLSDRMRFASSTEFGRPWLDMLEQSHRLGELFCLGLHPERIFLLEEPLRAVLQTARCMRPGVWIARLDEIAHWWLCRAAIEPDIRVDRNRDFHLRMRRARGLTVLTRNVKMISPYREWEGAFVRSMNEMAQFSSSIRPFIGVSPSSDPALVSFLRQQGLIVEVSENQRANSFYFDRPVFKPEEERAILEEIYQSEAPLVCLSRWPFAAKSALAITGDIDAVTFWDYCLRLVGK